MKYSKKNILVSSNMSDLDKQKYAKAFGDFNLRKTLKQSQFNRNEVHMTAKIFISSLEEESINVLQAIQVCLAELKTKHLDVLIVSVFPNIEVSSDLFKNIWQQIEKALKTGLIKEVGVSKFTQKQLTKLLSTTNIIPTTNQVQKVSPGLMEYCKSQKINLTSTGKIDSNIDQYLNRNKKTSYIVRYSSIINNNIMVDQSGIIISTNQN